MSTMPDDIYTDDVAESQNAISGQLADLSQCPRAPRGVAIVEPFDSDEVDWQTRAWMSKLSAVQGWLVLARPLDETSPELFVASLDEGLRPVGSQQESSPSDAGSLDLDGLVRLRDRCSKALERQQRYVEDLEEDVDGGGADQRWRDSWADDDDESEQAALEPVSAKADVWSISDFADRARSRRLNLSPSYQRGDVWPTTDAQILMESILRGIPLPSVIILKPQNSARGRIEVVDGKQRLTAILRFIGAHPVALETVSQKAKQYPDHDLERLFKEDYRRFRLAWKNATGEALTDRVERTNYFPFRLRAGGETGLKGRLVGFQGRYYCEIRDREFKMGDGEVTVSDVFERSGEYKVPLIQYTRASPRQIHEVFKLYNKQGKQLNAEEIRNAMFHELDLMKGLLVAAGDSAEPREVAPFLFDEAQGTEAVGRVLDLPRLLTGYGFGVTRYKRTKVLSWLASLLVLDTRQPGGKVLKTSTSSQIDALLRTVEDSPTQDLRDRRRVGALLAFLGEVVETHSAVSEVWNGLLRRGRWEEMPLVGSLLGVAQAVLVLGQTEVIDRLEDNQGEILARTRNNGFHRPGNIQTWTQWGYISRLSVGLSEILGAAPSDAHAKMQQRFGSSGVAALEVVAAEPVDAG